MRHIEILAFPGVQLLDVTGPLQVFASANDQHPADAAPYCARVVATTTSVASSAGLNFTAALLPAPDDPVDTLIIAGGGGVHGAAACNELVAWLSQRASRARRVASICTGAFLLGAAGLLNGRRVVTHWKDCGLLARKYPNANVESDPIFIHDCDIWTSAGVTAGIDLSLAFVESDLGHCTAIAIARDLVVYLKRPGGQAQFSAALTLQGQGGEFEKLNAWIADNLTADLSLPALAARLCMSERNFVRRFKAAIGVTPGRAVEKLRVEGALHLLASSTLSVKRIAQSCGFGSEETMRRSFLRQILVTPHQYRERFGQSTRSGT